MQEFETVTLYCKDGAAVYQAQALFKYKINNGFHYI